MKIQYGTDSVPVPVHELCKIIQGFKARIGKALILCVGCGDASFELSLARDHVCQSH